MSALPHIRVLAVIVLLWWLLGSVSAASPSIAEPPSSVRSAASDCTRLLASFAASRPEITGPYFPRDDAATARLVLSMLHERFPAAQRIERIGSGSESVAYLVVFNGAHSLVVKVPRRLHDVRVHEAFDRERRILRAVRSADPEAGKYLIEFYGRIMWRELGVPMLVSANAGLGNLESVLHQFGPATSRAFPHRFLRAWTQMATAIRGLHSIGIVHRDIKPSNFLVTMRSGELHFMLSDFGLSTRQGGMPPGLEGLMSGTLTHMSANQLAKGVAERMDDIHGLYMTFREMLMGKTIWHVNPSIAANNIELVPIDYFGTYPILRRLPDSVARDAQADLVDFVVTPLTRAEDIIFALNRLSHRLR